MGWGLGRLRVRKQTRGCSWKLLEERHISCDININMLFERWRVYRRLLPLFMFLVGPILVRDISRHWNALIEDPRSRYSGKCNI
jgi:hypothetical protein